MSNWYERAVLRAVACSAIGRTDEYRAESYDVLMPEFAKKWEEAEDPTTLMGEYASDWYALTLVECFCNYTAANVKRFASWWGDRSGDVLDLGAGIGASTRLFEELTGSECTCHVYGPGGQMEIAKRLVGPSTILKSSDERAVFEQWIQPSGVMAFELFEHIREPVALGQTIFDAGVEVLCCANAFGAVDFGHWRSYLVDGIEVPRDKIGRVFARRMREMGWKHVKTDFWNDRPSIWVRGDATGSLF